MTKNYIYQIFISKRIELFAESMAMKYKKKLFLFILIPALLLGSLFYISLIVFPIDVEDSYTIYSLTPLEERSNNLSIEDTYFILNESGSWDVTITTYMDYKAIMITNHNLSRMQLYLIKRPNIEINGVISHVELSLFRSDNTIDEDINIVKSELIRIFGTLGITISEDDIHIDDNDFTIMFSNAIGYRVLTAFIISSLGSYFTIIIINKGQLVKILLSDSKDALIPTVSIFIGFLIIYLLIYVNYYWCLISPHSLLFSNICCFSILLTTGILFLWIGKHHFPKPK